METAAANGRQWWSPRRWWAEVAAGVRVLLGMDSKRGRDSAAGMGRPELPREETHPFDRENGTDTGGLIYADPAAVGHAGGRHNAGYYATAPSLFRGAMELWRTTLPGSGYAVEDFALVDIGCGKGRVLMLAAEYPFREIVGVELDPGLARVARKNLRRFGRRRWLGLPFFGARASTLRPGKPARRARILSGDALTAPLPDGPVALFYFNSFEREMMEMWLQRVEEIARARTAPLDLIYIHPEFNARVRQAPGARVMAEAEIPFSEQDAGADAFGVGSDGCVIFRWN